MKRLSYPSDLTEKEWAILSPLIPPAKPGGHPRTTDIREVINAILYLDRTGGQWRALPHEFPRLYDGVELLPHVAQRRHVETDAHSPARTGAPESRAPAHSQRRHHRQSRGSDDAKRGARGYDGGKSANRLAEIGLTGQGMASRENPDN